MYNVYLGSRFFCNVYSIENNRKGFGALFFIQIFFSANKMLQF